MFSANLHYFELARAISKKRIGKFRIDDKTISEFLYGDSRKGKAKEVIFKDIPMNIHFCVKVSNPVFNMISALGFAMTDFGL